MTTILQKVVDTLGLTSEDCETLARDLQRAGHVGHLKALVGAGGTILLGFSDADQFDNIPKDKFEDTQATFCFVNESVSLRVAQPGECGATLIDVAGLVATGSDEEFRVAFGQLYRALRQARSKAAQWECLTSSTDYYSKRPKRL